MVWREKWNTFQRIDESGNLTKEVQLKLMTCFVYLKKNRWCNLGQYCRILVMSPSSSTLPALYSLLTVLLGEIRYLKWCMPTSRRLKVSQLYHHLADPITIWSFFSLVTNLVYWGSLQPTRSFRKWSTEASMSLRDCIEWLMGICLDVYRTGDCTTDYLNSHSDTVILPRTVWCFPSNKP